MYYFIEHCEIFIEHYNITQRCVREDKSKNFIVRLKRMTVKNEKKIIVVDLLVHVTG